MDLLFLQNLTPDLPPEAWWLPAVVILCLAAAAAIDCFTAKVPEPLIFFGLLVTVAAQGFYVSWPFAAAHLALALAFAFAIWGVNTLWHWRFKHDAIGMGDAKWTMLAAACFGLMPCLVAWGAGACLAVLWLGVMKVVKRPMACVHFAPFLFMGLMFGLFAPN